MASPSSLLSILVCACCHNSFQDYPSTLACGHSVCAVHVEKHTCNFQFNSSSSVTYIPEEDNPPSQPPPLPTSPDVTLLKVHTLVRSAAHDLAPSNSDNADLHNDSDDDRPRKRRRRRSSDSSASDDDLLSHLRTQSLRQRLTRQDQPLLPSAPPSTRQEILARFRKDLLSELSCEICFTLFYQPVTTPCQHTFCSKCLHRALDHSPVCPICRQNLPPFLYFQEHPTNTTLYSIILKAFPEHFQERKEAIEEEERNARLDTPIFVCQLSFPGMPTLLHFFEPRYRLMLRRCLESQRPYFGMIMPPKPGSSTNQTEYGTMLEIRTVQPLSDGRSLVEAWGSYRFRILESGTLDGYLVGRIERIDDYADELDADPPTSPEIPMPPPPSTTPPDSALSSRATSPVPSATASTSTDSLPQLDSIVNPIRRRPPPRLPAVLPSQPSNAILMERCRSFLDQLERGTAPWIVQRLSNTFGQMPPDVASFSFWVASILPIDEFEKAKLLPIRSPRLRLLLVVHWIEQLNNNWYSNFLLSPFYPLRPLVSLRRTLSLTVLVFLFLIGSILWHSPFYLASVQKVVLEWMRNSMTNCASSSQQD